LNIPGDLNSRLTYYAALWGLELEARQIETFSSSVAFGRQGPKPVVLKLIKAHSDEHNSWRWLQYHAGRGAVALLEFDSQAVLLEQAVPGTELAGLVKNGRDEEATHLVCRTIKDLHTGKAPLPGGFPAVEEWAGAFERNSREILAASIPLELLDKAHTTYRELCASQGPRYLLHGDLHHYNILQDGVTGWKVIDPKGVVGELAYETGAMLRNPFELPGLYPDPLTVCSRVKIICQELGLAEKRVLGWCFSQAVLSAVWTIEDGGNAEKASPAVRLAGAALALMQQA
jgi:streptomycin 6-kinase